jgi:N-methylhydantoinase B/oxoprolinase/acetone carboxylase alpha subunit
VAYEFTGNSCCSSEVPNRIMTVIKKSHEIGLTIRTLKSDMGPQNRGVWRLLNINAHKHSKINNSIPHPCMENEKLFVMPYAIHVFKNVADSLTSGHRFYLDQRTVGA